MSNSYNEGECLGCIPGPRFANHVWNYLGQKI